MRVGCSPKDVALLQDALWHHPASIPFLRYEKTGIDTILFADLVEERYIDNFIIDICISKFFEKTTVDKRNKTVQVHKQLADTIERSSDGDILPQIVLPVHVPNH